MTETSDMSMSSNQTLKETQDSPTKVRVSSSIPQPGIQISSELQQQISLLNARANSANLAYNDLLKEITNTLRAMTSKIMTLQQEITELKV